MNKTDKKKESKIIFDEKIDKSISGFALVFAFIIIGILLQFDSSFFGEATSVIKITFIIVGILGLLTEISNLNINYNIKGLDNIGIGFFLLVASYLLKVYVDVSSWYLFFAILFETGLFFFLLISMYGFCRGIIEMFYSIYKNYKEKHIKENLFSSIIVTLTQLFGLVLILAQIYDIFK